MRFVVADFHRPATEHKTRPHQAGIANPSNFAACLLKCLGDTACRLLQSQAVQQVAELLAVFSHLDRVDRRTDDRQTSRSERPREVQRRLPPQLHDHAIRLHTIGDVQHILTGQRLKEEQVAGVVVGADRLRVGVDHHTLNAHLAEGKTGVTAAVVKLDSLADAVRTASQDHHAFAVGRLGGHLILALPRRVEVRGFRLELRSARVNGFVGCHNAQPQTRFPYFQLGDRKHGRQLAVGEAGLLGLSQQRFIDLRQRALRPHFLLDLHDLRELIEKPDVNLRDLVQFGDRKPCLEGIPQVPDPIRICDGDSGLDLIEGWLPRAAPEILAVAAESKGTDLEASQSLLESLFKGAADRHRLAHALHLRGEPAVSLRKLLKGESWDLHNDVVDGRFEAGFRLLRDVVGQFVKTPANGKLGSNLRDRKSGGLAGKRRRATDAGIHLDHDHPTGLGMHRKLDVRPSRFHTDRPNHRKARVPHPLILAVRERHRGSDGDRVASMDPAGVEVFDSADDDGVVVSISHHLHLVLFPAEDRLLNQDFPHR